MALDVIHQMWPREDQANLIKTLKTEISQESWVCRECAKTWKDGIRLFCLRISDHGTDTMVETGLFLLRALPQLETAIVLTGAMTPLGFEGIDGLQNLAERLSAVQLRRAGVHVVFQNRAYPVHRVFKDRTLGRFVWKDETAPNV